MADTIGLKDALHEALLRRITEGEKVLNKEGEVETIDCPASVLSVAREFVKQFPPEAQEEVQGGSLSGNLRRYAEKHRIGTN